MNRLYDTIGVDYAALRRPDPRLAAQIDAALGSATTILNVGAGSGSYEPPGRVITAVEPSAQMIRQRPPSAATVIQASAEDLPFEDRAFDAAMAVLTVHHWQDPVRGLREMRRVTRGPLVILTYDPAFRGFWLADYVPALVALDDERMPPLSLYAEALGPVEITPAPIPHDCVDGFLCAYWRRPAAYLDPRIRAAMSSFWAVGDVSEPMAQLAHDLESGEWHRRYGASLAVDSCDLGYRLVVAAGMA
jgi:SAM-dependent methyltransferase